MAASITSACCAPLLHNFSAGGARQGASTITMQVARNFFLSKEKTFTRKFNEALLAFKIEHSLTKDQILELYINQIYLGQRAYGFASAAQVYFGKNLRDLNLAEMAMLAGLPKAPSRYNPVVNMQRAKERQLYVLRRMRELNFITQAQFDEAQPEADHRAARPAGVRHATRITSRRWCASRCTTATRKTPTPRASRSTPRCPRRTRMPPTPRSAAA